MTKIKLLIIGLSLVFNILALTPAQANLSQMIEDGIAYLDSTQDQSSWLWGTAKETPYRDAAVVVDVLGKLDTIYDVDSTVIENGFSAINAKSTNSTDYLARKIIASASANQGVVDTNLVNSLVGMQNADGGWGYQKYYGSNVLETSLAIRALVAASYVDPTPTVLTPAANYLISCQQNSRWAFVPGITADVFFTSQSVGAISALQDYDARVPHITNCVPGY